MKHPPAAAEPEFSYPIGIDKIPPSGLLKTIEANKEQRAALSTRFDLIELSKFAAEFHARPLNSGSTFSVVGKVIADVVQRCVVTLEPLPSHIECAVDVVYAPSGTPEQEKLELETEETEVIVNGVIDLGELAAQHLGVALAPYPRKPGVPFVAAEYGDSQKRENPFVRLVELSKNPKEKG